MVGKNAPQHYAIPHGTTLGWKYQGRNILFIKKDFKTFYQMCNESNDYEIKDTGIKSNKLYDEEYKEISFLAKQMGMEAEGAPDMRPQKITMTNN